jgi:hypothetical protein
VLTLSTNKQGRCGILKVSLQVKETVLLPASGFPRESGWSTRSVTGDP